MLLVTQRLQQFSRALVLAILLCNVQVSWCRQLLEKNAYIVELARPHTASSFLSSQSSMKVRYTYDSDLFYGASVQFPSAGVARSALAHPDVLRVWDVVHHTRPYALRERRDNTDSVFLDPFNSSVVPSMTSYYDSYRELGVNGSSIRVGVIDSGVDYRHPALGGCFGKGCKIAYGYDLVGDDYNGTADTIKEDDDPLDNCPSDAVGATGHGTFVSGIIGAVDKTFNWTGAAPGATLGMWRVFGCASQVSSNDVYIKAMEMAYKAGMDVVNLSFGENGGWKEDIVAVMADRMVAHGVNVVVASGNIGTSGLFLTASPATARNVIAVGSTTSSNTPAYMLGVYDSKQSSDVAYFPYRTYVNLPVSFRNLTDIVATSAKYNATNDACDKLTDERLNGSIALIHEGGCSLLTKADNAYYAGAAAVVIYTDDTAIAEPEDIDGAKLAVAFINSGDGKEIFARLKNQTTKGEFTKKLVNLQLSNSGAGRIAGFTSLGPTNELSVKPELCAVGTDLLSTLPLYKGSYGIMSGTSFSAPLVTASVALFLDNMAAAGKQRPDPVVVKDALMNFARPVRAPLSQFSTFGDSPLRQGAGVVNIARAIQGFNTLQVTPSKLSFNDTEHLNATQTLTVYNHGSSDLKVHMIHGPALTVIDYDTKNTSDYTPLEPITFATQNGSMAGMAFSTNELIVPAGGSAQFQVRVTPPSQNADSHPVYGGYIGVETSDKTMSASVPYIGMVGNMSELPILDRSSNGIYPFPSIGNPDGTILQDNETGLYSPGHNPTVLVRLLTGTPFVDLQVIRAADQKLMGSVPYDADDADDTRVWLPRNTRNATSSSTAYHAWVWDGHYVPCGKDTTESVPSDTYYIRVRALRVFSNPSKDSSWDTWTSPPLKMEMSAVGDDLPFSNDPSTSAAYNTSSIISSLLPSASSSADANAPTSNLLDGLLDVV